MRRTRERAAGVVALVAALASGCALVVDGLSTDFSAADDGAAPATDAGRQDATATDAADADSSAPPLPAPTVFAAFPLCSEATTNAWHLDCGFGVGGSVVVGNGSGITAPVLTEGAGSTAVYVAVARDTGTFIEAIDGDGGRTVFAIPADAGIPIDLATTSVLGTDVITMLSNGHVNGTMAPVVSSKVLLGTYSDFTNDIGMGVDPTLDASIVAVRPLAATPLLMNGSPAATLSYFVNYFDGAVPFAPGRGSAQGTSSGVVADTIQPLDASGPDGAGVVLDPIANGVDIVATNNTWVVGFGNDGGSTSYAIPDDTAPATRFPLPYVVDDSAAVVFQCTDTVKCGYPLVAGRVDGCARVNSLDQSTAGSSLPNFPFDDPGVGPLRLRAVYDDGGVGLLVAGASASTRNLYLALYSILYPFSLTAVSAFGDGGVLVVPLQFRAELGGAVRGQGGYYVSLTLTGADAGMDAVVIRIAPPGSP